MATIISRLRFATEKLRRTSMPISDIIPLLQYAADEIEELEKQIEGLVHELRIANSYQGE
jgi:HAMP domain-containing protein